MPQSIKEVPGGRRIPSSVGTLNEGPLHASLRKRYLRPGDRIEAHVDGYIVDILRDDQLIEIQTANFSAIARKLRALVERHPLLLVFPVPRDLWIVKLPRAATDRVTRRRSPKRRQTHDVFRELVSFPDLITHPNFQLDVVLTAEESVWRFDSPKRWRRRGWITVERRLLDVYDTLPLRCAGDYWAIIPPGLPDAFLSTDLANALCCPRRLAQQAAYCLRHAGLIVPVGRAGNAIVYARSSGDNHDVSSDESVAD